MILACRRLQFPRKDALKWAPPGQEVSYSKEPERWGREREREGPPPPHPQ